MHRIELRRLALVAAAVTALAPAGAMLTPAYASPAKARSDTAAPTAGSPERVSGPSPFADCTRTGPGETSYVNSEVEPWVDVNPADPDNIIGVWQQDRWSDGGARGLVAGVSHDGGATWSESWAPFSFCSGGNAEGGGDFERASDSWVTFSPNGDAYQIAIAFNGSDLENGVLVSKSTDGGDTWSDPATLIRDSGLRDSSFAFNDKESITADPLDSRYVYAVWDRLVSPANTSKASFLGNLNAHTFRGPAYFSRTTDGGKTWEKARAISDPGEHNQTIGNQIVVLPNGDLIDVFVEFDQHKNAHGTRGVHVKVIRSTDKGATWSDPITVASLGSVGVRDPQTGQPVRTGDVIPDIAVNLHEGTPGYGDLYVVWQDARFSGFDHDEIALSRSSDGGRTWSEPVKVNRTPVPAAAFTASVHVAADGTPAVTYYDFRNDTADPDTLLTDYFLVRSQDRGATFGDEERLTPTSFDMKTAPDAGGFFVGDYEGLASIGDRFVPVFVAANSGDTANRTDAFETQTR